LVVEDIEDGSYDVTNAPQSTLDAACTDTEEAGSKGGYVIGEGEVADMGFAGGEKYFIEVGISCA
jgi:hypothetical protein